MNPLAIVNAEQWAATFVASCIILVWHWSTLNHRQLAASFHGELIRRRHIAVSCGLALCLLATCAVLWTPQPMLFAAPLTGIAVIVHAALEPSQETFWHHHRIRLAGALVLAFCLAVAAWGGSPPLLPLLGSLTIFHTHHRQNRKFLRRLLLDIDQLNQRNLSLSARVHNQQILPLQSGDDIRSKAS